MNVLRGEEQHAPAAGDNDQPVDELDYEAFLAWKIKGKGKGKEVKGKGKGKGDPICVNCGGKHRLADCTKPIVPMDQRPCFKCGKPGHPAWRCPEKGKGANSVEQPADALIATLMRDYNTEDLKECDDTTAPMACECSGGHCTGVQIGAKRSKLRPASRLCNLFGALEVSDYEE